MTGIRVQPLYFGHNDRPLFGWLHTPTSVTTTCAALLCGPIGNEALCAHRALKYLADCIAAAGMPVFRFDYDGTGDSAGCDADADRVDAWTNSIALASDELRKRTGTSEIAVIGVRLGALLAAQCALGRDDVAGFIAVAPVANGRTYLRELRVLQTATLNSASLQANSSLDGASDTPPGAEESGGFVLAPETLAAIHTLDLKKCVRAPARQVLILDRRDLPQARDIPATLTNLGASVSYEQFDGYNGMVCEPHNTVMPSHLAATMVAWLQALQRSSVERPVLAPIEPSPDASQIELTIQDGCGSAHTVRESAIFVDGDEHLFGIVSEPVVAPATPRGCILLLNAGATYHIGPNRMYVEFARRWSANGFVVMRVDLSGLGDSAPRPNLPENEVYSAAASGDVFAAIRYFEKRFGATNTIAIGLCSGGYHAFKAALSNKYLRKVVLINPLAFFRTPGESLDIPEHRVAAGAKRLKESQWNIQTLRAIFDGRINIRRSIRIIALHALSIGMQHLRTLARAVHLKLPRDLGNELLTISRRGVRLHFVFSASDPGLELLRMQGGNIVTKLRRRNSLEIDVIDGPDHTFTPRWSQSVLFTLLTKKAIDDQ